MRSPQVAARHADRTGAVNHGKTGSDSPISRATTRQLSAAPSTAERVKAKA